jgi:hypothetical protein
MQLVGTPGVGLLAQLIERHDQQRYRPMHSNKVNKPGITPLVITRQNTR